MVRFFCHTSQKHLWTASSAAPSNKPVGDCFSFQLHIKNPVDCEAAGDVNGRQRNEIKVYGPSPDKLKGFKGETMIYEWKFRIGQDMLVSSKFTHIFQMKFVGGEDSQPAFTFSGSTRSGSDEFQIRYKACDDCSQEFVKTAPWSSFQHVWMYAKVEATMSNPGAIAITIKRVEDDKTMLSYSSSNKVLWRGNDFMRPKWGLYRDITAGGLNDAYINMADFCITKKAGKLSNRKDTNEGISLDELKVDPSYAGYSFSSILNSSSFSH